MEQPLKQLTVNETGQIKIIGKWKAGELLAIADEIRRLALGVEIDFKPAPQQPPDTAKETE